ncbi:hypothetical protein BZG02_13515 [Labilibaculum filiforme]|uniref:DUF3795 domain-containing protein n=1 Tax=Labilibaculum filiforme TaxID=1940526 RepID=A0A2N3HW94_9BACT|nr:DUF3795 domain-containing protein [Labilibaculum filiforme]PKQ62322.1 hypothetical protein BZG02_13515 [Labilibaculum filiforme]
MIDAKKLTAPCGLACWACNYYKDNITAELAENTAVMIGMTAEEVACEGCRSERGCAFEMPLTGGKGCVTKKCVEDKGLHNCSECNVFPCENLMPVVDGSDRAPHNTKIYNLSRIKLIGLEEWAKEASMIQQKYFKGKFVYGQAPSLS